MSFHIDILRIKIRETGEETWVESDYSIDDCVKKGWLDPQTSIWTREYLENPDPDDDEWEYLGLPCKDRKFGENLKLNLQQIDGRWVAVFGNIHLK